MRDQQFFEQRVTSAFERRQAPLEALLTETEPVARTCHAMAERFHRGGKLIVFGNGGGSTDAQHVSVEFVHPVIMGKRALPALSLTADVATMTGVAARVGFAEVFAHQLRHLAESDDIALGLSVDGHCENVLRGLEQARELGLLTVALLGGDGGPIARSPSVDHALGAASSDPRVVKEVHVTMYHILWELVHVFFDHPGVLTPGARTRGGNGMNDKAADCAEHGCVTCSDEAVVVRIVRLLPGDMALVETERGKEEVSVGLVDGQLLEVGADILVHAKEAIGVLR